MIRTNLVLPCRVVRDYAGRGKRPWIVIDSAGTTAIVWMHSSHIRYPVRYATQEAAQRVADKLNAMETA